MNANCVWGGRCDKEFTERCTCGMLLCKQHGTEHEGRSRAFGTYQRHQVKPLTEQEMNEELTRLELPMKYT